MTVVAVRKTKTTIEISCDEQVSYGGHKYAIDKKKESESDSGKIYKVNGMLIGGAGKLAELTLFKLFCQNHKPAKASQESVIEFMLEFRNWVGSKIGNESYTLYNNFILVMDGKIFDIHGGFDITEKDEFWAIGSGMFLAISALYFGKTTKEAVEVAKKYDMYCGGDTHTLTIQL